MKHIFMVGAKLLGAYRGYETSINKLTEYHQDDSRLKYYLVVKVNGSGCMDEMKVQSVSNVVNINGETAKFTYHNACCFKIHVPNIDSAQAIYCDVKALSEVCKYVNREEIKCFNVYIIACCIGLFMGKYCRLGGKVYLNSNGSCEIIMKTGEKPVKLGFCEIPVTHYNYRKTKNTQISNRE
jgi:rhamnosyltransferase